MSGSLYAACPMGSQYAGCLAMRRGNFGGLPDGCALQPQVWCLEIEAVTHFTAAGGLVEKADMSRCVYVRSGNEAFKVKV